ncbi:MAG TPA: NF038122 family metalloprotease [Pyrinomonadaceae bacterium]|nr:NF038122 family metalloprotease [Pyrinomonadaceae bacterium]
MRKEISLTFCLLALIFTFAGSFAGPARAQSGGGQEYVGVLEDSFILYQNEQGETVCRPATPEERARIRAAAGTHVIYRGAPLRRRVTGFGYEVLEPNSAVPSQDSTGLALLPSAGLTIVLQGTAQLEANPAAKAAFIAAANRWEAVIATPITVTLSVDFGPNFFDKGPYDSPITLGQTGSYVIKSSGNDPTLSTVRSRLINSNATAAELALYNALPVDSVPVEYNGATVNVSRVRVNTAQALALGFNLAAGPDAQIGFNSNFGSGGQFDFDPSDGISSGFTDFDAVVVHEIGHALGFVSENGGSSSAALTIWDLFRFRPGAAGVGNFASAPRVLTLGGTQVMFGNFTSTYASQELGLSTGGPTGSSEGGGDGQQSSHWRDDFAPARSFIGVMDPTLSRSVRRTITENDIRAIDLLGYSVAFDPQRPANDNFANAVQLSGLSGSYTGTNVWATREPGELAAQPNGAQAGFVGDKSVWFTWTAPASGTVTFTTQGSNFDTTLGVYTGDSVGALTYPCVFGGFECTNDNAGNLKSSTVQFNATAGATYRIDVDGWNSESGTVVINWSSTATTPTPTPTPTPPASFQLVSTASTVVEHQGAAGFVIARTGNLTETTSVNYSVTGGTAVPGADFVETTGTVNFAGGDLWKVVTLKVNDDTARESSETVVLTLTSASGGSVVGAPSAAVLTILDDDDFPPNSVRISGAATQAVAEGGGHVEITVTRSGDTSQAASVDYRTADGTALGTRDYTFAGGTLDFAAGEATKTFAVLVTEDVYVEGEERFTVALSNPSRTTLDASQTSIQVAVQDDDTAAGGTNPNDASQSFVRQHYQDFLNREPDAEGLAFWTNDIEQCGTDQQCQQVKRINVSAAFFLSIEFQETGGVVYRAYQTAYGSGARIVPIRYDEMLVESQRIGRGVQVGVGNWRERLEANKTAFFNELVDSGRFRAEYPAELTPTQFVDKLIRNAPSYFPQRDSLVAQLTADPSQAGRVGVVRRVAESDALKAAAKNPAFVLMEYFGYMRRNPDDAPDANFLGYNHWLGKLQQFDGDYLAAEMVKAFLESIEYRTRFAP